MGFEEHLGKYDDHTAPVIHKRMKEKHPYWNFCPYCGDQL